MKRTMTARNAALAAFAMATAAVTALSLASCWLDPDEEVETIDFSYDGAQKMTVVNNTSGALTVTGEAMYVCTDDAGAVYEFVRDTAATATVTVAAGETGTIGFRSVAGITMPNVVSWEAAFTCGGKTLRYAGYPATARAAGDATERKGYGILYWKPVTAAGATYAYAAAFSDITPLVSDGRAVTLTATVTDDSDEVQFTVAEAAASN